MTLHVFVVDGHLVGSYAANGEYARSRCVPLCQRHPSNREWMLEISREKKLDVVFVNDDEREATCFACLCAGFPI